MSTEPTRTGDAAPPDATRTSDEPGTAATRDVDENATRDPSPPAIRRLPTTAPPGYEIESELGRGGMGIVYRARQTALNRTVALKMVRGFDGADAKALIRFLAEAEAVAAVRHPHIVQVYESGRHGDGPYIALEYLGSGSLSDRLRAGQLDARTAAELVAKLANAAHAAHAAGIVHRDLKPGNILFDDHGEPRITDFGVAKRGSSDLTHTQAVMGTPAYMAPEQASGGAKFVGPAADVWALGVILYECLTGKRPFDADDTWGILQQVQSAAPLHPRRVTPNIPRDLELICLKCLEKEPARRYASAVDLATDLARFLGDQPVSVRPAGPGERFVKWCRRNPAIAGFTAALVTVALLGFAGVTWALLRAEDRGKELAKSNDDLNRTNDDLIVSRNSLFAAQSDAAKRAEDAEARGYFSDIALAHQLWKANDFKGMRAALARCPEKRRKWEWHYLDRLSRPEVAIIPTAAPVGAMEYSPDGTLLAYLTRDGTLTVRDIAAGKDRFRFETPEKPPPHGGGAAFPTERYHAVVFRSDGKELIYLYAGKVWSVDMATGTRRLLEDRAMKLVAIGYNAAGKVLIAEEDPGGFPHTVGYIIREWPGGKQVAELIGPPARPSWVLLTTAAAFNRDGTQFAAIVTDTGNRVTQGGLGPIEPKTKVVPLPPAPPQPELAPLPREVGPVPGKGSNQPLTFEPEITVWNVTTSKVIAREPAGGEVTADIAFEQETATQLGKNTVQNGVLFTNDNTPTRIFWLNGNPYPAEVVRHTSPIHAVASADGRIVWVAGEDRVIRGRRSRGIEDFTLGGCPSPVTRLAASRDGKFVAGACADSPGGAGAIHIYNLAEYRSDSWRQNRPEGTGFVTALSPVGDQFAEVWTQDILEDPESEFVLRGLDTPSARTLELDATVPPYAAARSDGVLVIAVMKDRLLVRYPDGNDRVIGTEMDTVVPGLAWTPNGKSVIVVTAGKAGANSGGTVAMQLHDVITGQATVKGSARIGPPARENDDTGGVVTAVAVDPQGRCVAATFAGFRMTGTTAEAVFGTVVVWDLMTGNEVFRADTPEPLRAVAFDPEGHLVVGGGSASEGRVTAWDVATRKEVYSSAAHARPVTALVFGPDRRLATAANDRTIKVWDFDTRTELMTLEGPARVVTDLVWAPNGRLIAATGLDLVGAIRAGVSTLNRLPPAEVRVFRGAK